MKIDFFCTLWGNEHLVFEDFLEKAKTEGYTGVEITFPLGNDSERERYCQLLWTGKSKILHISYAASSTNRPSLQNDPLITFGMSL